MAQINAYLSFGGNCREAMTFYQQCLGGELELLPVGESPMADQIPTALHKSIIHASLTNGPLMLLATDMGGDKRIDGNSISLSLTCNTENELKDFFAKLSDGGEVTHPLHDFFAGTLGTLTDKFGMPWMLYYDKN